MGQKAISGLMDKWMNDVAFRAAICKDPWKEQFKATSGTLDADQVESLVGKSMARSRIILPTPADGYRFHRPGPYPALM